MKNIFGLIYSIAFIVFLTCCQVVEEIPAATYSDFGNEELRNEVTNTSIIPTQNAIPIPIQDARDRVVIYLIDKTGAEPVGEWILQNISSISSETSQEYLYTSNAWVVRMKINVDLSGNIKTYHITVDHMTEIFRWEGTVDSIDGTISELSFIQRPQAKQP